ncbi:MAG: NUDIX hydrolase [Oscillospiraceae bacterium]|jgi:ADP-ribose pyrophosphatase|nr:NUDIX hydrolase [Oscillospiraceae bacterium]
MPHFEKQIDSAEIYSGRIIRVRRDTVLLDNGKTAPREIVEHAGGVGVVAITDAGEIVLVRQYRYAVGQELIEIPAGKLEYGEDPFECAKRELSEETGYDAREWRSLGRICSSPGFCSEVLHLYLATGLTNGAAHPDDDEFLDVLHVKFSDFLEMIASDEVTDAKTVVAALKAERYVK